MSDVSQNELLCGRLCLYSDGPGSSRALAFEDSRFIARNTTRFACRKCTARWDKNKHPDGCPCCCTREARATLFAAREALIKVFPDAVDDIPKPCALGTHDFALVEPVEYFDGDWLFLENGDELTIYAMDDPTIVLWSGVIDLDDSWVHGCRFQRGVDARVWLQWFYDGHLATLQRASSPGASPLP